MKTLSKSQLAAMDTWMQSHGRAFDRAKWNHLIHGGPKADIITEMLKYQNSDGGFGHGFEADVLLPLSAAIPSAEAIFQAYDFDLDCRAPWFGRLLDYFEGSVMDIPAFWEGAPPEVDDYPHAPWWSYKAQVAFSPNPCAVVASALILYGTESQRALGQRVAERCLAYLVSDAFGREHDYYNLSYLLTKLKAVGSPLFTAEAEAALHRRIAADVCYDQGKWKQYVPQPLDFADSPQSPWLCDVSAGIEENLAFWLDDLGDAPVWTPNFSWGQVSAEAHQATENWKGYMAAKRVRILQDFGRVEA